MLAIATDGSRTDRRGPRRLIPGARLAAAAWRRWFLDRQTEFWLRELGTRWSLTAARARVVEVIDETSDTRTLVLAPARRWPGHRAGQYVPVELEIDGIRVRRCYSISSGSAAPGARRIAITVRRVAGGRMSSALHALRRGAIVELGQPTGEFVLGAARPKLLLVAGGSGITPIMAMIRDLAAAHAGAITATDVIVVHSSRGRHDAIFGRELANLATDPGWLRIHARRDDAGGRLDPTSLRALVPDLCEREIFVCGPPGLMEVVTQAADEAGAPERVHRESFVAPALCAAGEGPAGAVTIVLRRSGTTIIAAGSGPLLAQLERAGERPAFGCRMGICQTCRCRKLRGTVEDARTGAISSEPDQEIRLCVSIAHSDLELEL
jgi:ferredoxin-NADP reductase